MKPITEKQRQALIESANEMLTRRNIYGSDIHCVKAIAEIALASLTAEPVGYTYDRGIGCEIVAADLYDSAKINCDLYSQPSVPVINLPDENEGTEHTEYHAGKQEGWNDCIEEIKRLNGIS